MCQRGKYHTTTPKEVRMVQNVNCRMVSENFSPDRYPILHQDTHPQPHQAFHPRRSGCRRLGPRACPFPSQTPHLQHDACLCIHISHQLLPLYDERAHRTSYFGSHCTYPLLRPLTSLTTNSKLLKSRAVTASKATSRRTRAHSKKA